MLVAAAQETSPAPVFSPLLTEASPLVEVSDEVAAPVPPDELTSSEDDSIPPVGPLDESRVGSLVLEVGWLVVVVGVEPGVELVVGSDVVVLDEGDDVVGSVVVGVPVTLPVVASEGDDVPLVQPSRPTRTVAAVEAKNARRSSVFGVFEELMIGGGEASR